MKIAMTGAALLATAALAADSGPVQLAPDIFLIEGSFEKGRQPDGNSIVFDTPRGLVVVDTGRHRWHRDKIASLAKARGKPVAAIVNTHWHLDHNSGNGALKAAWPNAKVYASGAIDGSLTGFLADSARQAREAIASGKLPPLTVEEIETDLATIAKPQALRPDVEITRSGPLTVNGRRLEMRLSRHAATAGDVWIYDPKRRIAVVGDLVTWPAPFLDTACASGWQTALAEVASTPFVTLVPGHGGPMSRARFNEYRRAFDGLLACAASDKSPAACADGWVAAAKPAEAEAARARDMASYYVEKRLRGEGARKYCPA